MTAVIVAAALAHIKAFLLAKIAEWKNVLPDVAKPWADQAAQMIGEWIDSINAEEMAQTLPGQVITLIQSGKGPASSSSADTA